MTTKQQPGVGVKDIRKVLEELTVNLTIMAAVRKESAKYALQRLATATSYASLITRHRQPETLVPLALGYARAACRVVPIQDYHDRGIVGKLTVALEQTFGELEQNNWRWCHPATAAALYDLRDETSAPYV